MELSYEFLQNYWWFLVSLLGAILVFLLFVQGGQSLIYTLAKDEKERTLLINLLGHKWEFTFTTLVTFGGAFFASFPLFYSTSFGGATYVWFAILFVFIIQAVSYEFRTKANNFLGQKTYEWFLVINGVLGTLLLGTAVATLFTGGNFIVDKGSLALFGENNIISQWTTPWRGLEAVLDYRNLALGLAVLFLSRVLASMFFINRVENEAIYNRSIKCLKVNTALFLVTFLTFLVSIILSDGFAVDPETGVVSMEAFKYLNNLLAMPVVLLILLVGVVGVLGGIFVTLFKASKKGIWFAGIGTVLTVLALFLTVGYNNTAFYPSLSNIQSSLTLANSSSSEFTLGVMSVVSLLIPFILWYIVYTWRALTNKQTTIEDIQKDSFKY